MPAPGRQDGQVGREGVEEITAHGLLAGPEIAAASPQIVRLCFGSGDFTRDLEWPSLRWSTEGTELVYARSRLVVDARSADRARPIDLPFLSVRDAAGFEAACLVARKIGFQGKLRIHPAQVAAANSLFAPDPDEVAFCRRVVAEFAEAVARGSASITVAGVFVDYRIAEKAGRIISTAEMLGSRDATAEQHCRAHRQSTSSQRGR